jgi:hypothetical protein
MTSPSKELVAYFVAVSAESRGLMDRLPIPRRIEPLEKIMGTLRAALATQAPQALASLKALDRPAPPKATGERHPVGMNTIGILADRLTILLVKEWCLRHKEGKPAVADDLFRNQTMEIIAVLAGTSPGIAGLLEKVSNIDPGAVARSWEEAYFGLHSANILMWETQEILYKSNMDELSGDELRDYIRFFSQANMERNAYIKQCETLYWR